MSFSQHVRPFQLFWDVGTGLKVSEFVRVSIKGMRPHITCESKPHHMKSLSHLVGVSKCEVSDVWVGLSYKTELFYLFLGIFPESELSKVFLSLCRHGLTSLRSFRVCVLTYEVSELFGVSVLVSVPELFQTVFQGVK